jgi:TonB family protein
MKRLLNIALLAVCVIAVQSCGSKSKRAEERLDVASDEASSKEQKTKNDAQKADRKTKQTSYSKSASDETIYNKAEISPEFPGGKKALDKYFHESLKYPESAKAGGLEGTIYVQFVIGKDGKVSHAAVMKETDPDTDQSFKDEAVRVVSDMPKWIPAKQRGRNVNVRYSVPVLFRLGPV